MDYDVGSHPSVNPVHAGGIVARAKRTDRAEARRRYRATLSDDPTLADSDGDDTEDTPEPNVLAASSRPRGRASAATPASPPKVRTSITGAFRGSIRPIDFRADLRALPKLILHRSVWLPVLLTVVAAGVYVAAPDNGFAVLAFQYFVYTPPVASIFLAGFMAPRASYLTGAIAGLVGAIAFSIAASVSLSHVTTGATAVPQSLLQDAITASFIASPLAGAFFGGAAGWYRRFLSLANPNRGAGKPGSKPSDRTRRRDSNNRPILARRR
jgi:hypothetical protein